MLPKWHVLFGAIFSFLIWLIFPSVRGYASVIFFASFLIDFDHYFIYVYRKKDLNLKKAYIYFLKLKLKINNLLKQRKNVKAPLCLFHTVEFLLLILILSFVNEFVFFIFIGFLFHSLLDIMYLYYEFNTFHPRSFSFILYLINRNKKDIFYL